MGDESVSRGDGRLGVVVAGSGGDDGSTVGWLQDA